MGYLESINDIKKARAQRDQDADALYQLQMKYIALERSSRGLKGGKEETILRELKGDIEKRTSIKKDRTSNVNELIGRLYEKLQPQQLIEEWHDNLPITLLPLRIETKYRQSVRGTQLMVRIYPDDIAVISHEKTLTEIEIKFGQAHWTMLYKNSHDAPNKRKAWKLLVDKFGINRAAWVAKETKPLNWAERDTLASEADLRFEEMIASKPDSWTAAAHTNVLPDRFVLTGYRGGKEVLTQVGQPIKDVVIVGPAPIVDENDPSFTRDETDQRILYGADYAWMADFNLAVQQGMGFVVPQSKDDAISGYDQLLVLGLKLSADELEAKQLLENLIDNHRYGEEGLSLLKQGTPTNNTETDDSGYGRQQSIDDMALEVENDQELFTPTDHAAEACDGQRLADYLGLDYSVFQSVHNSQIRDHAEAVAMNTALHPGTLGYFTSTMLNGVLSDADREQLRRHFIDFVSGRGPLPAIRIGNQPYGLIVTSDFENWRYQASKHEHYAYNTFLRTHDFYKKMYEILHDLTGRWKEKVTGLSQITKGGDAGQALLNILGLHPGSVEFFQRTGYSYDYLSNLESFGYEGKYFADTMLMAMESMEITALLKSWRYRTQDENGRAKTPPMLLEIIFRHYHTKLDKNNVVDTEPISETAAIKPYAGDTGPNYIDWLIANMADESSLESQDFGTATMPKTLLFMMLKNGLLLESNHSIFKYLATKDIHASELLRSRKFMNISTAPSVSPWEIYKAPVNRLVSTEPPGKTLYNHIHTSILSPDITLNLTENKAALEVLKDLPTAHLHRAFTEHLDILSYRLDAWQTSLFDQRITAHRNLSSGTEGRKKGVYLGSYGYLENVKMRDTRKKIDESVLPEGLREEEDNLFVEQENGGFVHAPSLNHATAAAILRNGYLTHSNKTDASSLSVNLSSERVRRAKAILEGIKNGQTLEALLGYQFERGMHEWSTRQPNPVILNQLKPEFRKAFPIKKTKVPQEGKTTGPEEITEQYEVVNGLALAATNVLFPFGIANLPTLTGEQIKALQQEKDQLKNTLDAVKDLLTAESAYQMASGNFDRAAAVMQAISNGNVPPEVEVINTARSTQMSVSNRIVLNFSVGTTVSPWPSISPSAKSITAPALNHWIGELLGDPDNISCSVSALMPDHTEVADTVRLSQLDVQPLDFVLMIRNKLETSGASELESRIRYYFLREQNLTDDTLINIQFALAESSSDLSKKSFAEILPYANYIRQLLGNSRPLHAGDFEPSSAEVSTPGDNPGNINITALQQTALKVYQDYLLLPDQNLSGAITAVESGMNDVSIEQLRKTLKSISDIGYAFAFPKSASGKDVASGNVLLEQAKTTSIRLKEYTQSYTAIKAKAEVAGLSISQQHKLLTSMIQTILGETFVVLPKFNFNNPSAITTAANSRDSLLSYAKGLGMQLPVNEFLHSASLVREKMHTLEMVRLLHENFNETALFAQALQLPYKANDNWLAVEFPKDTILLDDTISYVQYTPQGFDPSTEQCGLLLDEWTETVPNREEVSGITFNYNQPNSTPPQAILLAVTPEETGRWKWDQLTKTVLNTFERARQRAVEPDDVDKMNDITTLLPATMAEFSTSGFNNISLDYTMNVTHKFTAVQLLESKKIQP